MEFSFDRSNDSQLRNSTQAKPEVKPEPVAAQPAETYDDGIDTSTIQNERLKKAIERNRARQAERARLRPEPVLQSQQAQPAYQSAYQQHYQASQSRPAPVEDYSRPEAAPEPAQEQASLFAGRPAAQTQDPTPAAEPQSERPRASERSRLRMRSGPAAQSASPSAEAAESVNPTSTLVTRRTVARPDETDFAPAAKRTPRKVASQISYTTNSSKKKTKPIDPTLVSYLIKGCWFFCGIMVLRLIFANGGVTDFYSRKSILNDRLSELDRIKKENMQLVHEIERMQTDTSFQKRLVRDNLGFIAADEFLILFPKEKSIQ